MKPQTREKIKTLIDTASTVWVASVDEDGFPNIKAMFANDKHEGMRVHLLSTNTSSRRAGQFTKNPKAALYFCAPEQINGVMLRGTMEVCTDARHRELLWNPGDEKYYPKGVTDPDYCVLRFTAKDGNCWLCNEGKTTFTIDELEARA
jgi:general stress protein 26